MQPNAEFDPVAYDHAHVVRGAVENKSEKLSSSTLNWKLKLSFNWVEMFQSS